MAIRAWIKGALFGAGMAYLYDPVGGRYRRSKLRDQGVAWVHRWQNFIDVGVRDLRNRYHGILAETSSRLTHEEVPDELVTERIRATMGHYVSHPSVIDVTVQNGVATLQGPVLAHEARHLISAVGHVRGVRDVVNQLEPHTEADIPELQGGQTPVRPSDLLHAQWSPATRLVTSGLGLMLMGNCLVRRNPSAVVLGTAGFYLFTRATSNQIARPGAPAGERREGSSRVGSAVPMMP